MLQENSFLDEIESGMLSAESRAYVGQRAKNEFYDFVVEKFRNSGLTQAQLAQRIGGRPDSLNRLLRNPGNWRLETGAVLLAGICGEELLPKSKPFSGRAKPNHTQEDSLTSTLEKPQSASSSSVTAKTLELELQ